MKTIAIFILAFSLNTVFLQNINAANYTWTGTTSTAWNNTGNWNPSGIPDSTDNVTIVSTTNQPILDQNRKVNNLTMTSGTLDLNGYEIQINGNGNFTSGTITNGNLKARGTLADFKGTLMDCAVDAVCGYIKLSGSQFEEDAWFEDTGYATGTGDGGNTFNGNVTIKHTGSGTYFHLATTNGDTFNGNLTMINTSTHEIHVGRNDTTNFNGNIEVNNTGTGGITFGNNGGVSYLANGKTITIGSTGFTNDILLLKNFNQTGSTAQTITLTGTATANLISCTFDGALTITAPLFLIKDNIFNGATTLTKNGASNGHSDGGNAFNGYPNTIANTGTAGRIRLSTTTADTYNENISFESTGQTIQPAYTGESVFRGNIAINHNNIVFNAGTGTVKMAGPYSGSSNPSVSTIQELNGTTNYQFKNLKIDKDAGYVTANKPLSIDNALTLTKGNLVTDTTNLLTMKAGSSVSGASNNSFVSGPVKKVGNTAFEFPVGKGNDIRSISITGTTNATNAYQTEYFNTPQQHGTARDTTLEYIAYCDFWKLNRTAGSEKVAIRVMWDDSNCGIYDSSLATLAMWNDEWINLGIGNFTGTSASGTISSSDSVGISSSDIVLAYRLVQVVLNPVLIDADVSDTPDRTMDHFFGLNGANMIQPGVEWSDNDFQQAIASLRPSTIRFPGGELGNWWDWREGWFVDRNIPFQQCAGFPADYEALELKDNHLETFRNALATIGGRPVFLLNMLTSDLPYQMAMLHEAQILGMPIRQEELGNEFYRDPDKNCEYSEVFPQASDYVEQSDIWMEHIRERFGHVQISVVGSDNNSDPGATRQNGWNAAVISQGFNDAPDAFSIHPYYGSGLGFSGGQCDVINYSNNSPNGVFNHIFNVLNNLESNEWNILDGISGAKAWMTEYNLFEKYKGIIHGSWAHGLKTAAFTLAMLENDWIGGVNCHTMTGNGIFSAFFNNEPGYDYPFSSQNPNDRFCSPQEEFGAMPTIQNSLTSLGLALQEIGDAMRFATEGRLINFSSSGTIPSLGTRDAIYGWHFTDDQDNEQMIIMNLSDQEVAIDLSGATYIQTPHWMNLISMQGLGSFTLNTLNRFVTNVAGNDVQFVMLEPGGNHVSTSIQLQGCTTYVNQTVIPAYSLMRYYYFNSVNSGNQSVSIYTSEDAVCTNRKFYLYANASPGATQYEWFYNNIIIGTTNVPVFLATADGNDPYHVVVTYGTSGTLASSPVYISINAPETLTVTSTFNSFCASSGTPIEIEASLSGSSSNKFYCWIPINGAEINSDEQSQLSEKIDVMPQQTSTYMVYATDGLCSVREEITIEVLGIINFGDDPLTFCDGDGPITLQTGLDPLDYEFDWGNNVDTETIDVNPQDPETYTVTVTHTGGCSVTASIDVLPVLCCDPLVLNPDIILTGNSSVRTLTQYIALNPTLFPDITIFSLNNGYTQIVNQGTTVVHVYVQDEFLIDENLDITKFKFSFADRATLIVENFRRLLLRNCELTSCSLNMWQGIRVRGRGLVNTFQNTIISNAYHGIYAENKTRLSINNTTFENNFTGIRTLGSPPQEMAEFEKNINRGRFRTNASLLNPYTNIIPLPANATGRGYAGIVAENDILILRSNSSGSYCEFETFTNGIKANNSILTISDTWFDDMQPETEYNWLGEQGIGISNFGDFNSNGISSLKITGLGIASGSAATFENCEKGVVVELSSLSVSNAKLASVKNGIRVNILVMQPIVITENIIEAEEIGIGLFTTDLCGYLDIRENVIHVNAPTLPTYPTYGIGMYNAQYPFNWSVCRINCNDITLGKAQSGITISGFKPYFANKTLNVKDNSILINDNSATENGILYQDVLASYLQHNSVAGSDPTDATATNAFRFFNSPSNVISQNNSDGTRVGFQFDFDCRSENNFRGNQIGDHFHGLELLADGKLDKQSYTGNTWGGYVDTPPPYEEDLSSPGNHIGAWADPAIAPLELQAYRFEVNQFSTLVQFPYHTPVNIGWFFGDVGSNPTFSYTDNCLVMHPMDPELRLGYGDSLVVYDSILSPGYEEEIKINSAYHLRDKLELIKQYEDIPSFFSNYLSGYASTANGKIARYRDTLSVLSNIGADSIDFITINDSILHSKFTEISMLQEEDSYEGDTLLEQANLTINSLSLVRKYAVEQFISKIDTLVYDLMDVVSTSHVIESNLKDAYLGFYNLLMGEDTSEIKSVLKPIANQCIKEGGPGVLIARNLLATMDTSIVYDDVILCGSSRTGHIKIVNSQRNYDQIMVFPNPSSGEITILLAQELIGQRIHLSVFDLSGKIVFNQKYTSVTKNSTVDLSRLEQGSYLLKIHSSNENYHQKISIIK